MNYVDDIVFPSPCERLHVMHLLLVARLWAEEAESLIQETDSLRSPICRKRIISNLDTASSNLMQVIYRLKELEK